MNFVRSLSASFDCKSCLLVCTLSYRFYQVSFAACRIIVTLYSVQLLSLKSTEQIKFAVWLVQARGKGLKEPDLCDRHCNRNQQVFDEVHNEHRPKNRSEHERRFVQLKVRSLLRFWEVFLHYQLRSYHSLN